MCYSRAAVKWRHSIYTVNQYCVSNYMSPTCCYLIHPPQARAVNNNACTSTGGTPTLIHLKASKAGVAASWRPPSLCFFHNSVLCVAALCLVATIRADGSDLWLWLRETVTGSLSVSVSCPSVFSPFILLHLLPNFSSTLLHFSFLNSLDLSSSVVPARSSSLIPFLPLFPVLF